MANSQHATPHDDKKMVVNVRRCTPTELLSLEGNGAKETLEKSTSNATAEFFGILGHMIRSRRALFKRRRTARFFVIEDGMYFVDTDAQVVVHRDGLDDTDLTVLCTRQTLQDMLLGTFDPRCPRAGHVFVWSGDASVLSAFASALTRGISLLEARARPQANRRISK